VHFVADFASRGAALKIVYDRHQRGLEIVADRMVFDRDT
jgi:hypothetical protein